MSQPTVPPSPAAGDPTDALNRARRKAFRRLLPLLFVCYVIAYVDRANVSIAKLNMSKDLPGFSNEVVGLGAGLFFIGYFLLEIPGTLLVERWSARKWICRIMITWGFCASLTAFVTTPLQFYGVRFLLGLAEAGFFPGVIVYLTHWFPSRDRAKALAWFFIATPMAQIVSPLLSIPLLRIGSLAPTGDMVQPLVHMGLLKVGSVEAIGEAMTMTPRFLGLVGWQWIYIGWGIPAVVLGFFVLAFLTDRPRQAAWLEPDEREALENELKREKDVHLAQNKHMTVMEALKHPKVLILAAAYFFIVTGNYGIEIFLPSILEKWYQLNTKLYELEFLGTGVPIRLSLLQLMLMLPPLAALVGQVLVGWSSDRSGERRLHTVIPIYLGAVGLFLTVINQHPLWLAMVLFTLAAIGLKAYLPAFWSLPNLFLAEAAAAGSIGLINSVGNLGGFLGPYALGYLETRTGDFRPGIIVLCVSMAISATIVFFLGLGRRARAASHQGEVAEAQAEAGGEDPRGDAVVDPV